MNWKFWKKKKKEPRKTVKSNLIYAFDDLDGLKYYRFSEELAIPISRFSKMQEFRIWLGRGLSDQQLTALIDRADEILTEGLKTGKNAVKLGAILSEIRERKNKCSPTELYYNFLAAQLIREDEDPLVYNEQVQLEKVEAFKRGANTDGSFFFSMQEFISLCSLMNISTGKWKSFLQECVRAEEELENLLTLTSSKE